MSITLLYLVRHGETNWNAEGRMQGQTESDLSELGYEQARQRSQEMLALGFGAAYCSSSRRTRQTIDGLLNGAVEQVSYRDDLREIRVGPWEGRLHVDLEQEYPELVRTYRQRPDLFELEGAETFQQLQDRGVGALTQIANDHRGEKVLVVSHGALIKATLLHFLGWPLVQMWAEPLIGNCSCSLIEVNSEQAVRVLTVADAAL